MRQMTGFLALTAAVAYLASRPGWYRAIIVLAALPIALTANVARIVLTGYIMFYVNPEYASGAYHTLEGILMMGFGLLLLHTLCLVLNQLSPPSDTKPGGPNAGASTEDAAPIGLARPPRPMLSGPAGWSSGGLTENLVSLRSPEE
jgi:exosortase/archaeosortase family protein